MSKPTVKFTELVSIDAYGKGSVATLRGVSGHPYLGTPYGNVYTSSIVSINKDKTRIETLNTIYVKD